MIYTVLGFMLLIFFCVYWCINEKIGLQLGITVLLSAWTVRLLKSMEINFPADIDIGWPVTAIYFCGYIFLRKTLEALFVKGGFRAYMIATAVVSFLLILYRPNITFIVSGGCLLGLGIGYCINKKFVGFDCANLLQRKGIYKYLTLAARLALGLAVFILMVYRVEKIIFGLSENQNKYLYGFLCYTLIGFWITVAAPWLFVKLNLAGVCGEASDKKNKTE